MPAMEREGTLSDPPSQSPQPPRSPPPCDGHAQHCPGLQRAHQALAPTLLGGGQTPRSAAWRGASRGKRPGRAVWAPLWASVPSSVTWREAGIAEARTEWPVVSIQGPQPDPTTCTHSLIPESFQGLVGGPRGGTRILVPRAQLLAWGVKRNPGVCRPPSLEGNTQGQSVLLAYPALTDGHTALPRVYSPPTRGLRPLKH